MRNAVKIANAIPAHPADAKATVTADVIAAAAVPAASNNPLVINTMESRRTIAQAARESGVHVETIRFYERSGLIAQPQKSVGVRHYPKTTVDRIRFIRNAADHGFQLKEIREMLDWDEKGDSNCAEVCGRIDQKIIEIDAKIRELSHLRDHLSSLVAASPRSGEADNCKAMQCFRQGHD
jgi:MerR family transcriptional regulator, copper efflux regulator